MVRPSFIIDKRENSKFWLVPLVQVSVLGDCQYYKSMAKLVFIPFLANSIINLFHIVCPNKCSVKVESCWVN